MAVPSQPTRYFPRPFAEDGNFQNVIPDTGANTGRASYTQGFPTETQLPIASGGVAPNRLDFNGLFNILTAFGFWQQSGGQWTYTATLNYAVPSIVYYNGQLWWCVAENGPDSSNGVVTPGTNESYWQEFIKSLGGGGGVPVGTVIAYYGTTAPTGYLLCNGDGFSVTQYPQLRAVIGTALTPDLRGLFVRGYDNRTTGSNDPDGIGRAIGSTQPDAIRNITGALDCFGMQVISGTGALSTSAPASGTPLVGGGSVADDIIFNAADGPGVLVGQDNRPKNMCLTYCIKHD